MVVCQSLPAESPFRWWVYNYERRNMKWESWRLIKVRHTYDGRSCLQITENRSTRQVRRKGLFFPSNVINFLTLLISRKNGLTYRVRVRIVTTTQNGTKHKELGLSTAVESPQPGTGSSRLGSYQSRTGTGKSIDREYKTKWIKACRAN